MRVYLPSLSLMTCFTLSLPPLLASHAAAFVPATTRTGKSRLSMVGGRGWDNDDYLSSLSGDEEDREKAQEDYQEFSDRRQSFLARQKEIRKTPQGRAFLEQQQKRQAPAGNSYADNDDEWQNDLGRIEPTSGGGSRMAQMMAQAKRMQEQMRKQQEQPGMGDFEQKFAPMDDDDE